MIGTDKTAQEAFSGDDERQARTPAAAWLHETLAGGAWIPRANVAREARVAYVTTARRRSTC